MKFSILYCLFRLTNLCDRWYIFLIKLFRNLRTAFALYGKGKNIPYNFCLFLIHYNRIFHFPAFLISEGNLSENIFAIRTLVFKRSFYLDRHIFAV